MAGINQVIMLALSMVVIAGMVGGGGLGGSVFDGHQPVDVGLGFEGGLAVVILAMYLDRMTGALNQRVSPLGRRALAKARGGRADGWKVLHVPARHLRGDGRRRGPRARRRRAEHLRRRRRRRPQVTGANVGKGKSVNIGYIPWDEGIASTFLWKELLEQRGYEPKVKQYDAGALYTGHGRGRRRLPDRLLAAGHPRLVLEEVPGTSWTTSAPGTARPRWSWRCPRT